MIRNTKASGNPNIIFFVGRDSYFLSHRLPTARAALEEGYDVHVIAANSGLGDEIEREGVHFHPRWLARDTIASISLIAGIFQLLIRSMMLRARIVQIVGLRYALVGLVASLFLPWTRFIFSVNGLGFLFVKEKSKMIYRIMRRIILSTFTIISTLRNIEISFQNEDDRQNFINATTLRQVKIHLIRGSGVDTDRYKPASFSKSKPVVFGMASRMIKIKGVEDIIIAFRQMIDDGISVKLLLAGGIDIANPDSLTHDQIKAHCRAGEIEWLGYINDMADFWKNCHVAILGSHGGEGLPMSLLIPAAMERPIICSDTSGNRDLVNDGMNGYLFPAGDIPAIKSAVRKILDADLKEFGKSSRVLIHELQMDSRSVNRQFATLYRN